MHPPYTLGRQPYTICRNPRHDPLRSFTLECSHVSRICRYCNPHLATARGYFVLSWMHEEARDAFLALVEEDLARGRTPPPYVET